MNIQTVMTLFSGLFLCASALCEIVPVRITNNPNSQIDPGIDGARIVWQDNRNVSMTIPPKNHWDIYLYDIVTGTERRITTDQKDQVAPEIFGDRIVWEDRRITSQFGVVNQEIFSFNLTSNTETNLSNAIYAQINPDVSDGRVVWEDYRNMGTGGSDIYLYDTATQTTSPICLAAGDQRVPKISDRHIVWLDFRQSAEQIYFYDLDSSTERPITSAISGKGVPAIYANKIVWSDFRNGNFDIYLYDLSTETETRITNDPADQRYPAVSEVGIVWVDYRNDPGGDLFFYDFALAQEIPLVTEEHAQTQPDISGNRIVWTDGRNDAGDIYLLEYSPPVGTDLEITGIDMPDPVTVDEYLIYTLKVANVGTTDATGVMVIDRLSPKVEYISAQASPGGTCSLFEHDVVVGIGNLLAKQVATITIVVRTTDSGVATNSAKASCNEEESSEANNSLTQRTQITAFGMKKIGAGWAPCIQVEPSGAPHLTYTRHGIPWIEHIGSGMGMISLCHLWDDIVYAHKVNERWVREIVFDGTGNPDPMLVANPNYYFEEAMDSALAVDPAGKVHIAYVVNDSTIDIQGQTSYQKYRLEYINNTTGVWSHPRVLAEIDKVIDHHWTMAGIGSLDIGADSNGRVHVLYMNTASMMGELIYITNAGGTWETQTLGPAYSHAALEVDGNNRVHLCYYSWDILGSEPPYPGIAYRTNAPDGIWQTPEVVDPAWTGGQKEGLWCDIAIDGQNRPHLSFVDGQGQSREDYRHAVKTDSGWQIELVATGEFQSGCNTLDTDPAGNAFMLFQNRVEDTLTYATNLSGSWESEPLKAQGLIWGWDSDIAVDAASGAHIVYDFGTDSQVWYLTRKGPDGDHDGVPDAFEQGPDGTNPAYDGNGDGTPDSQQDNVTSFETLNENGYVTLAAGEGITLSHVVPQENPDPGFSPGDGESFVYDCIGFTLMGLDVGGSATVTLYLPEGAMPTAYYKYGPTPTMSTPHWYNFYFDGQTGAEINGNVITLHFRDGFRGDNDLMVNGVIVDPGAPAIYSPCVVDLDDLLRLTDEWMMGPPSPGLTADLDGDGKVGLADFAILAEHWMQSCPDGWPMK